MTLRRRPALLVAGTVLLAGCSAQGGTGPDELATPSASPTSEASNDTEQGAVATATEPVVVKAVEQDLDAALSEPVEDSVYPAVGDPRIDALLYDLDLD